MESRHEFFEKIAFLVNVENLKFCLDLLFPSSSVYFFGPAGGRSLRARVPHMEGVWFIEGFCRRVIPPRAWLADVVAKIVLFAGSVHGRICQNQWIHLVQPYFSHSFLACGFRLVVPYRQTNAYRRSWAWPSLGAMQSRDKHVSKKSHFAGCQKSGILHKFIVS